VTARLSLTCGSWCPTVVDAFISKSLLDPDVDDRLAAGSPLNQCPAHSGNSCYSGIPARRADAECRGGVNYVESAWGTGTTFFPASYTP